MKERQKLCIRTNFQVIRQLRTQKKIPPKILKMELQQTNTRHALSTDAIASATVPMGNQHLRKKNLTPDERVAIGNWLLVKYNGQKLDKNAISTAAATFSLSLRTVSTIWKRIKDSMANGDVVLDMASRKKGRSGGKRKDWSENLELIKDIPLKQRGTLRSLSHACNIPASSLCRLMKEGDLKRITSTVKPTLTEKNKVERLMFASKFVMPNGTFHSMFDYVHIDEKWFYLTHVKRNYYLLPEESTPKRSCKSKRFITKVMFMAAVARPQYDAHRKRYFNGKIGVWPFITNEPARRNSKNRPRGTLETKAITSVTKDVIKEMIVSKVMPAIREKMPLSRKSCPVYIQQDNAKPHASAGDTSLLEEGLKEGWNIVMTNQPPNSPDFNVLDLGFFNSIQSLTQRDAPKNIDELIESVGVAFENLSHETLDNTFISYQKAMESSMKLGGSNQYKLEHMSKKKQRREGTLATNVLCDPESILIAREKLDSVDNNVEIAIL